MFNTLFYNIIVNIYIYAYIYVYICIYMYAFLMKERHQCLKSWNFLTNQSEFVQSKQIHLDFVVALLTQLSLSAIREDL